MKKSRGFMQKAMELLEKHYKKILYVILTIMIAIPVIVWLMYSVMPSIVSTEISADGMLSYLGSTLGGAIALIAAVIAVIQSNKEMEANQKQTEKQHQSDIFPRLQVELETHEYNKELFKLTLVNCGEKSALDIYLYSKHFKAFLLPRERYECFVSFTENEDGVYRIDEPNFKRDIEGYPEEIFIQCRDIDDTMWQLSFKSYSEEGPHIYEMKEKEEVA